ncbi:MOSC domain-containing protein [Granulosicoccus sp. 3-233]|uniref:MOSC domain-containing protein n=1 Tax=Granulosicoccus sp. 3-233 TaxID=3417969 RepID=UPI003D32B1DF
MAVKIAALTRFPIKGLSGQTLETVTLEPGQGFPGDRRFGFARPNSGFDPADPKPLPKGKFYMLARDAALALLDTEYDDDTGILSLSTDDISARFDIGTADGKHQASQFLKTYLTLPDDETPQLHEASPHRFTDVSVDSVEMMNAISIINRDSVEAFSQAIGQAVDPRRFRGNIQLSGLPPFAELDMVGKEMTLGSVRLKIVKRTRRCPATEVNLETGERDMKTPRLLREHYSHMDMGVYAQVLTGGVLSADSVVDVA